MTTVRLDDVFGPRQLQPNNSVWLVPVDTGGEAEISPSCEPGVNQKPHLRLES